MDAGSRISVNGQPRLAGATAPGENLTESKGVSVLEAAEPFLSQSLKELADLSVQRLALMERVALAKWPTRENIHKPEREQVVLDNAQAFAKSASLQLSKEEVQEFVQMQMDTAKNIQYSLFDYWTDNPLLIETLEQKQTKELEEIRLELGELTPQLISAFNRVKAEVLTDEAVEAYISVLSEKLSGHYSESVINAEVSAKANERKVRVLSPMTCFFEAFLTPVK